MKTLKQTLQKLNWLNIAQFVIVLVVALAPVIIPRVADAQLINGFINTCPVETGVRCSEGSLGAIFKLVINWALAIAAMVAVIMLIYGGFLYITSAGNADNATKGKTAIVNALIGLVVIILSFIIVQIVYRFVSGGSVSGGIGP